MRNYTFEMCREVAALFYRYRNFESAFFGFSIRGDLMIGWSDLEVQPLYVMKISDQGPGDHYTVNYPNERISSLELWGNKVQIRFLRVLFHESHIYGNL